MDTGVLLRNQFTRTGVEMWVKVYSPNVAGIEVVQRKERRARRARLYFMRYVHFLAFFTGEDRGLGGRFCANTNGGVGNRDMIVAVYRMW